MATTAKRLLSNYAAPGWVLIIASQFERVYSLIDAWSNLEFITEKVRDTRLLAFVAGLFATGWFQVLLIATGLTWIALASSSAVALQRFWPLGGRAEVERGEDLVYLVQRSIAHRVADRQREWKAEGFPLVQDDRGVREYSRQEVDRLTPAQRERLFAADPEMRAWWRGKSPTSGTWPLFRTTGGIWIAKQQIDQTPQQHHRDIFAGIPDLLDWYLRDRRF